MKGGGHYLPRSISEQGCIVATPTVTVGQTKVQTPLPSASYADVNGNDVSVGLAGLPVSLSYSGPVQSSQNMTQSQILAWVIGGVTISLSGAPAAPVTVQIWDTTQNNSVNNFLAHQQQVSASGPTKIQFDRAKKFQPGDGFTISVSAPGGTIVTTISINDKWTEFV